MNMSPFRAAFGVMFTLAALSLASPSSAQQKTSPWPHQPPAQGPAPAVDAQPAPTPATSDTTAAPDGSRSLKSTTVALRELSPWSMFVSADILVKAVMIGLAFASLV